MAQPPRELTPTTSAAHALGAELRRRRLERGLSQATLGALVHHSGALIGKIEKAERVPSVRFCELVDSVLATGGLFSTLRTRLDPDAGIEYACFGEPSWTVDTSFRALRELNGGAVDRRDFLAVTGTALAATAASWSNALGGVHPVGAPPTGRLGRAALDRLTQRLADLRRLDDELGGTVLCDLASAELRWLTGLAESARGAEQHELLGLVAEAARLCGWLHFDAGRHAAAQAYYATGLRCSASGDHPLTGANILAGMSWQAASLHQCREALQLLDFADHQVGRSASPRLRALLASRRARAHARAGDVRACGCALNEAEKALGESGTEDEPSWMYYFDETELSAQAGSCWLELGQLARARTLLDDALSTIGDDYVRDRSVYHARSAQTACYSHELELACHELATAALLARRTGSAHSITTVRQARHSMSGYDRERSVIELDGALAGLIGGRRG